MESGAWVDELDRLLQAGDQADDIDGTVHTGADGMLSLLLFVTTPGGVGNVMRIGEHLDWSSRPPSYVGGCECGPESSCCACLRAFRNDSASVSC